MSQNRDKYKFDDGVEAGNEARKILSALWRTPSMQDKLPKYVYEPLMMLQDFVRKHGWSEVKGL